MVLAVELENPTLGQKRSVALELAPGEMREIAEQGFPALRKPVDPEALRATLSGLLDCEPLQASAVVDD